MNLEKKLKNLFSVTEFLFDNQEELQQKLDIEVAQVETFKREATTYRLQYDQLEVRKSLYWSILILEWIQCLSE